MMGRWRAIGRRSEGARRHSQGGASRHREGQGRSRGCGRRWGALLGLLERCLLLCLLERCLLLGLLEQCLLLGRLDLLEHGLLLGCLHHQRLLLGCLQQRSLLLLCCVQSHGLLCRLRISEGRRLGLRGLPPLRGRRAQWRGRWERLRGRTLVEAMHRLLPGLHLRRGRRLRQGLLPGHTRLHGGH